MNLEFAKTVDRTIGALANGLLAISSRVGRIVRPVREVDDVRTILLVKLWGMGNLVLLYPVFTRIREAYPNARIVLLTLECNRSLGERHPGIDEVLPLRIDSWRGVAFGFPGLVRRLRRQRPDLVLDFEQFCHLSGILAQLSGGAQRIGFGLPGTSRGGAYHVRVGYREDRHMGEVFTDIARAAGVRPFAYRLEPVPVTDEEERAAEARVGAADEDVERVLIHAGSGDNFPGRRWPAESYAEVAARLLDRDPRVRILLSGVASEVGLVESIRAELPRDRTVDLAGATTLGELAAILGRCRLVLSNDTGPVHLAGAMGVPVFGFYGPNTPVLYGPLGARAHAFYLALPCSPCITNANGKTSSCRMPVCMRQITVDDVLARIDASRVLTPSAPTPLGGRAAR